MKNENRLTMQELRELEYKGLLYLKAICDENKLDYYLIGGTLLGAVKYNGYIPWDDDIDIALKREDYNKLIKIIENDVNSEYKILTIYNTKDYYYPFAKLVNKNTKVIENAKEINDLGVYVDVFPMDNFDNDVYKIYNKTKYIRNLTSRRMRIKDDSEKNNWGINQKIKDAIYGIIDVISLPLGYNFWARILDKILSKNNKGKYVGTLYFDKIDFYDSDLFLEKQYYLFEKDKFKSMRNYDLYLTKQYGDYKKDLPKSKQVNPHQMEAYWR